MVANRGLLAGRWTQWRYRPSDRAWGVRLTGHAPAMWSSTSSRSCASASASLISGGSVPR